MTPLNIICRLAQIINNVQEQQTLWDFGISTEDHGGEVADIVCNIQPPH